MPLTKSTTVTITTTVTMRAIASMKTVITTTSKATSTMIKASQLSVLTENLREEEVFLEKTID